MGTALFFLNELQVNYLLMQEHSNAYEKLLVFSVNAHYN